MEQEIDFILETAAQYLAKQPDAGRHSERLRGHPAAGKARPRLPALPLSPATIRSTSAGPAC